MIRRDPVERAIGLGDRLQVIQYKIDHERRIVAMAERGKGGPSHIGIAGPRLAEAIADRGELREGADYQHFTAWVEGDGVVVQAEPAGPRIEKGVIHAEVRTLVDEALALQKPAHEPKLASRVVDSVRAYSR